MKTLRISLALLAGLTMGSTTSAEAAAIVPDFSSMINIGGTDYYLNQWVGEDLTGGDKDNNDCSGGLGTFPDCSFPYPDGSPLIAKYEIDDKTDSLAFEDSDDYFFDSIDGSEFAITGFLGGSGTFTYTPGVDDPALRYWSTKSSDRFDVFWLSDAAFGDSDSALILDGLTIPWVTGTGQGLSHITFYDTEVPDDGGGSTTGDPPIPEPASLLLLGTGLLAVGYMRRKKKS